MCTCVISIRSSSNSNYSKFSIGRFYSKQARGTSARIEFCLCGDLVVWRDISFPPSSSSSSFPRLLKPAARTASLSLTDLFRQEGAVFSRKTGAPWNQRHPLRWIRAQRLIQVQNSSTRIKEKKGGENQYKYKVVEKRYNYGKLLVGASKPPC
jgi:hypothetical protein